MTLFIIILVKTFRAYEQSLVSDDESWRVRRSTWPCLSKDSKNSFPRNAESFWHGVRAVRKNGIEPSPLSLEVAPGITGCGTKLDKEWCVNADFVLQMLVHQNQHLGHEQTVCIFKQLCYNSKSSFYSCEQQSKLNSPSRAAKPLWPSPVTVVSPFYWNWALWARWPCWVPSGHGRKWILKTICSSSQRSFGNFCSPLARKMYWFCFKIIACFKLILEVTEFLSVNIIQILRNSENFRQSVCQNVWK